MKIIFDDEQQKENFIQEVGCPNFLGLKNFCKIVNGCIKCWECAVEIEILSDNKD